MTIENVHMRVSLHQERGREALEKVQFGGESPTFLFGDNFLLMNEHNGHMLSTLNSLYSNDEFDYSNP
jgi:hypothetical protein